MNAAALRHFYEYHFTENRNLWNSYVVPLSNEQFTREADYAHGSVRNQLVHLVSVDDTWFSGLRGLPLPEPLDPADFSDRQRLRAHWDRVEEDMRTYLAGLQDEMLLDHPFDDEEDKNLILWQVLLHVANHGTDHRAQILRLLSDLGIKTTSQDYIFFVYDNP